jgi:glycosyltransferase involved in cell wall biosynthesis
MKRVCHLSSAHCGLDVRIFMKECASLAMAGYDTHLVINATAQDVAKAAIKGVSVHPLTPPAGRFSRMFKQAWRCYNIGRRLNADVYHFHDAELIPYGMLLSLTGKQVIYDVHEDLPQDILSKEWISLWARKMLSGAAAVLEYVGAKWFFSVLTATPFIAERFRRFNPRTVDINNFPILGELDATLPWADKRDEVCYVGGIGAIRGIRETVKALELVQSNVLLNLGGRFVEPALETEVKKTEGWSRVNELGFLDRLGVRDVLGRSIAGLVTLHPIINYLDALPVKMFEYMAAGIPPIASNFPLWREIIEGNNCGLCVDPLDPAAIAQAIDYLVTHPDEARRMGENGRRAVLEKYNWSIEEAKLLRFYKEILA